MLALQNCPAIVRRMKRVIVGILVAAIVAGAGYGGWRVLANKDSKNNNSRQQTQTPPKTEDSYLVFKEWGVRMKLSDDIKDAYYVYDDNRNTYIGTKQMKNVSGCESKEVMGIQRAKKGELIGPSNVNDMLASTPGRLTNVGEYYYLFTASPFPCASRSDTIGWNLLDKVRKSLEEATKKLEEVANHKS